MVVDSRHQHASRRRAIRRCVEVGELNPLGGKAVDIGSIDLAAVGSDIGIAHVVGENEQDIRARRGVCADGRGGKRDYRECTQDKPAKSRLTEHILSPFKQPAS